MRETIRVIETSLKNFYPLQEIRSLTFRILESVCHIDGQFILLGKDKQLSTKEKTRIEEILQNLKKYQPIQYILGETEFYGLPFKLTNNVLIPRPETEELIEWINRSGNPLRVLDVGTGSGCIAVSIAKYNPEAMVSALDFSEDILEVAKQNAELNDIKINFIRMNILEEEPDGSWDVIVSNPPYIVPSEKTNMSANVLEYEPHSALFVPEDNPLLFYERIAEIGKNSLTPGGSLYFEINPLFADELKQLLQEKGYQGITIQKDISGKSRMIRGIL